MAYLFLDEYKKEFGLSWLFKRAMYSSEGVLQLPQKCESAVSSSKISLLSTDSSTSGTFVFVFENTEQGFREAFLSYYEVTALEGSTERNGI